MTSGFDLGHDLDLEFSRSNIEFAISQPKMVRFPRNEKQTYRLNSGAQMWPAGLTLAMTLTLNFQGKYRICYISAKNCPIATKRKANISIELQASNVTNGMDLPDSDWGDFSCRRAVDSSSSCMLINNNCYVLHKSIHSQFNKHYTLWRIQSLLSFHCVHICLDYMPRKVSHTL